MRKALPSLKTENGITQKVIYERTSASTSEGKFQVISLPAIRGENHELNARIDQRIAALRELCRS